MQFVVAPPWPPWLQAVVAFVLAIVVTNLEIRALTRGTRAVARIARKDGVK